MNRLFSGLSLVCCSWASLPVAAQPAPVQPAASPAAVPSPLRVAMNGTYWPLHAALGDERFGLEAELAAALARELGVKLRYVASEPGISALDAVATGKADLAISAITATDSRRQKVDFTAPYLELSYRLLLRRDTEQPREDGFLSGKRVAAATGPALEAAQRLKGAVVVPVPSLRAGIGKLKAIQVDFVLDEDVALVEAAFQGDFAVSDLTLGSSPLAIAVPKGKVAPFDVALQRIRPFVTQLVGRYQPGLMQSPDEPWQLFFSGDIEGAAVRIQIDGPLGVTTVDRFVAAEEFTAPISGAPQCNFPPLPVRGDPPTEARVMDRIRDEPRAGKEKLGEPDGWLRLPDGTRVTAVDWSIPDTCSSEEQVSSVPDAPPTPITYDCTERGWYVVAVRGTSIVMLRIGVADRT